MSVKLKQLSIPKVTMVHRAFETPDGDVEIKLNVKHKRITSLIQSELSKIANAELEKIGEEFDRRRKVREELTSLSPETDAVKWKELSEQLTGEIKPRNITCLQLEFLVDDLDIVDEKGKPVKPTYENLIDLPTELVEAIKEEIDNSTLPKKTTSTNSLNGMPRVGSAAIPQVG